MDAVKRTFDDIVSCLQRDSFDIKMLYYKADSIQARNKFNDLSGRLNKIIVDLQKLSSSIKEK